MKRFAMVFVTVFALTLLVLSVMTTAFAQRGGCNVNNQQAQSSAAAVQLAQLQSSLGQQSLLGQQQVSFQTPAVRSRTVTRSSSIASNDARVLELRRAASLAGSGVAPVCANGACNLQQPLAVQSQFALPQQPIVVAQQDSRRCGFLSRMRSRQPSSSTKIVSVTRIRS